MLLVEILAPELNRRLHMTFEENVKVGSVKERIFAALSIEQDFERMWDFINVDGCYRLTDSRPVGESGIKNGGIILVMRREGEYGNY